MSNEAKNNQTKIDETAQKLAAALEQATGYATTATPVPTKAPAKNVVSIAEQANLKNKAQKAAKPAAKVKTNVKAKAKPVAKKAVQKQVAKKAAPKTDVKATVKPEKKPAQASALVANSFSTEISAFFKQSAMNSYEQNSAFARSLLQAKTVNELFAAQSNAARDAIKTNFAQALELNKICAKNISNKLTSALQK